MESAATTILVGAGATAVIDLWAIVRTKAFGIKPLDYALVGRWIGWLPRGRWRHDPIAKTPAVSGERFLGWTAHYAIGIAFAGVLVAVFGSDWLSHPTPGPALAVGIASVAAPFLVMQPGMGSGIAASRTPRPAAARLQTLVTHTLFGAGLYLAALLNAFITNAR